MELSSFQLMGVQEFHPEIAVITNLMPTHIDYHGSFEEYVAAKWNIQNKMTAADFLVLNFNQDLAKELARKTQATVVPFSTQEKVDGAYLEDGQLYFRGEVVMAASEIGVPGSHNVENALATIAVAKLRGLIVHATELGYSNSRKGIFYIVATWNTDFTSCHDHFATEIELTICKIGSINLFKC